MTLKRKLLVAVAVIAVLYAMGVMARQIYYDSCRCWKDRPPWSSFCPTHTKHGRMHT